MVLQPVLCGVTYFWFLRKISLVIGVTNVNALMNSKLLSTLIYKSLHTHTHSRRCPVKYFSFNIQTNRRGKINTTDVILLCGTAILGWQIFLRFIVRISDKTPTYHKLSDIETFIHNSRTLQLALVGINRTLC